MIKDHKKDIVARYVENRQSCNEIAEVYNCSAKHIERILKAENIPRRTKKEAFNVARTKGRVIFKKKKPRKPYKNQAERWKIISRAGLRCVECGFVAKSFIALTIDNNMVLCWNCSYSSRIQRGEVGSMLSGVKHL